MNHYEKFLSDFLVVMQEFEYVFLDSCVLPILQSEYPRINLLMRRKDAPVLSDLLASQSGVFQLQSTPDKRKTILELSLAKGGSIRIDLIHQFIHNSLVYLDEEKILSARRLYQPGGWYMPDPEHYFEYLVVKNFLNEKGLKKKQVQFFEEYHILMQERWIESFNKKYDTSFNTVSDASVFSPIASKVIMKQVRNFPANRFLSKVNARWNELVVGMRRTGIF